MQRVVSFYEALPRGPAPEVKPRGLLARYQDRYFGKNPSAARTLKPSGFVGIDDIDCCRLAIWHAIIALMVFGYAQNYYFHLRQLR